MGFEKALVKLLKHEGGYSNHEQDNGGETYKGISRNFYPKFSGWVIVDSYEDKQDLVNNIELDELVSDFYYAYYWYKLKADDIEDEFVAELLFNYSVNLGKRQVIKKVQRILGTKADGIIGVNTLKAINGTDAKCFTNHFLLEIVEFYVQISKKQNNHLFLNGWLNRAMSSYYDSERHFK